MNADTTMNTNTTMNTSNLIGTRSLTSTPYGTYYKNNIVYSSALYIRDHECQAGATI